MDKSGVWNGPILFVCVACRTLHRLSFLMFWSLWYIQSALFPEYLQPMSIYEYLHERVQALLEFFFFKVCSNYHFTRKSCDCLLLSFLGNFFFWWLSCVWFQDLLQFWYCRLFPRIPPLIWVHFHICGFRLALFYCALHINIYIESYMTVLKHGSFLRYPPILILLLI